MANEYNAIQHSGRYSKMEQLSHSKGGLQRGKMKLCATVVPDNELNGLVAKVANSIKEDDGSAVLGFRGIHNQ